MTSQTGRFGYSKANVDFRQGYIEDLKKLSVADNSVDVVISNCVINLSPDKQVLQSLGCHDFRVCAKSRVTIDNHGIEEKIGMVDFFFMTIRAFKLPDLEDLCEDYGQVAVYKGVLPTHPHFFDLDDHHRFFTGKPMLVCGNTASMLQNTRFFSFR